jgi:hypothetical protein
MEADNDQVPDVPDVLDVLPCSQSAGSSSDITRSKGKAVEKMNLGAVAEREK